MCLTWKCPKWYTTNMTNMKPKCFFHKCMHAIVLELCHKWFLVSLYSCKNFVIIVFKSLVSNKQLHTFPEGKVSQEDSPIRRLKWGTASLIVRAPVTPIILPIVHHGLQEVIVPTLLFFSYNLFLKIWIEASYMYACKSF